MVRRPRSPKMRRAIWSSTSSEPGRTVALAYRVDGWDWLGRIGLVAGVFVAAGLAISRLRNNWLARYGSASATTVCCSVHRETSCRFRHRRGMNNGRSVAILGDFPGCRTFGLFHHSLRRVSPRRRRTRTSREPARISLRRETLCKLRMTAEVWCLPNYPAEAHRRVCYSSEAIWRCSKGIWIL